MSPVEIAEVVMWAASVAVAAWKLAQLGRAPRDRDLRAVTGCTVLVALALTAQLAAAVYPTSTLVSQSPKLIQNVLLTAFFALLLSLLASARNATMPGDDHRGGGYREPALAGTTSAALVVTFFAAHPAARGSAYGTSADPAVLTFYLIGNLYMLYATLNGARLTWSAATGIRSRAVRVSLRVAGSGLVLCAVGCHLPRSSEMAGQLATGAELIPHTAAWTPPALAVGIVVFSAGLLYPGLRSAALQLRFYLRRRREYRRLAPLWDLVQATFPALILLPPAPPLLLVLRGPSPLRYYRRVVECRDGLAEVSSWLTDPVPDDVTPAQEARLIYGAIARRSAGQGEPSTTPVSVFAAPGEDGTNADTAALVHLADALVQHQPRGVRS